MAQIVELKSSDGSKLYPITKTTAVYNNDGIDVDTLLATDTNNISVLTARMDQYESMPEGSTTGDAELMDVRIGFDGTTYDSAGTAVREQIADLNEISVMLTREMAEKIDGAYVEDGYLYLTSDGVEVVGPLGPFSGGGGGGGGGGDNNAVLTLTNASGWLSKSIAAGSPCPIMITWSSLEDEIPTGPGSMSITINGIQRVNIGIEQGLVTFDVGPYLSTGVNAIRIKVTDSYNNIKFLNFTVTSLVLSITSSFDTSSLYQGSFQFSYIPTGDIAKIVHFIVDGEEIGTREVTTSGRLQSFMIPAQNHGSHTLRCYFEAVIDEQTVRSNELVYDFMATEEGNNTPIITTSFTQEEVNQYATLPIKYRVYTPTTYESDVSIYVNDNLVTSLSVDRTEQTFSYHAEAVGETRIKIVSGVTEKVIIFTVKELDIDIEAETEGLSLFLSAAGRSNREANPRSWVFNDIEAEFTGFNMISDGWQQDKDGITVLRVTGNARLSIPYKPFATDFRSTGKTIEIEFATREIRNYDSSIISCLDNNRGFSLTAQRATLKSEQSEIFTQYKEDEHVRIAFVVERQSDNRLIYIYINGIMSGAIQYPVNDDFAQITPKDIVIGSNDCTVDVYCIRVYDQALTRFQVVDNWIADTGDGELMYDRYVRNRVFDSIGNIIIANLPQDLPYMILTAAELPQSKGDKKNVDGSFTNPSDASKSFTFEGAQADVQGTSSQYYPRKNYKIKFKNGFTINNQHADGYAMNSSAIPTSTFTFKADFASSEGANNVELVRLYNEACPYKTPPQKEDSRIRQGIDGFPMVMFWNNGTETTFVGKDNAHVKLSLIYGESSAEGNALEE